MNTPREMTDDEIRALMTLWRDQHPQIIAIWASLSKTPPPRAAVLGDIVEPWVWAYKGHAMPNGTIYADVGVPVWRSNSMEWHGV